MNRSTLLVLLLILFATVASAQPRAIGGRNVILDDNAGNESYITTSLGGIGINMININPNACAILDLNSQTKGFLPPRMVPLEIAALCGGTPPEGLIVYNTHTHTLDIWNGSSWTGQWQTTGNTNMTLDNVNNLLGTTSISTVKPFNLIVGGDRIMRYEVNNRIQGGHPSNTVHPIAHGAIIAGGGQLGNPNQISQHGLYSVIGGGRGNTANGAAGIGDAVVGGGIGNNAAGPRTTIGGGYFNTANNNASTIGGGADNATGATAQYATIGGGNMNTNNGTHGTIAGGIQNQILSTQGAITIGGGNNNTANVNAFQATISGGSANSVDAGGATIGGGFGNINNGSVGFIGAGQQNTIGTVNFAFIGGGVNNTVTGGSAVIGGGASNTASGGNAFIGGGQAHIVSGGGAAIAGGWTNQATAFDAFVGAGGFNIASGYRSGIISGELNDATGDRSVVGGGYNNTASGIGSVVGGGGWDGSLTGSNVASGHGSFVGGGRGNTASGGRSVIAGGSDNSVSGGNSTIGGGGANSASGGLATIAGGNLNIATGNSSTVGGGLQNVASGEGSFVGGGSFHTSSNGNATIAGGTGNTASGLNTFIGSGQLNRATDDFGTIGGGQNNQAGNNSAPATDRTHATVAGGQSNTASGTQSFIGGGLGHNASGTRSTIGGGETNTASTTNATVGGGRFNTASGSTSTVGGGNLNTASGSSATVAGGNTNTASGSNSFVAGGSSNTALGDHSAIAGGRNLTLGTNSFGYNADNLGVVNVSGQSNIAYFGNVDLLIGNDDNTAQQLRFYENNSSLTLAGADFASFQAPAAMTATTQYALPVNFGNAGGGVAPYILADVSGAGSPRQLTWISGNSSNWLLTGNSGTNSATNFLGTTDATDFSIRTNNIERIRFDGNPQLASNTDPLMTISNPTPNQQGLRINGTQDATLLSTLAANPGVWDLVVNGDAVVSGILKMGGSLYIDAAQLPLINPHSVKANRKLILGTTTDNDLSFMTNNAERMFVDSSGKVGIGTRDPLSPLHIQATPPTATTENAAGFLTPLPIHHVMTVENMNSNARGNGIAVVIHNPSSPSNPIQDGDDNDNRTNYMTFYNGDAGVSNIRGRIEGFSYNNLLGILEALAEFYGVGDLYNPFNYFTFDPDFFDFDPGFISFDPNFLTFNANFINFSGGSLPSLSGGSLPSLTGGSFSFTDGITWPTFSPGSLPSLSPGSLPSISWSAPVVLNGSPVIINGSPLINFENPFSLNQSFLEGKANILRSLPYKDKLSDFVMNPVKAAMYSASAFLGGVTYESGSGDYAEWMERMDPNEEIGIGEVVGVHGGKVTKNTEGTTQLMVATWKPIVLGNMPDPDREQDFTKIAFMGQVPVRLIGGCRKGDYILPSGRNDGMARALSADRIDAADLDNVLGVAWDDIYQLQPTLAKVAVGLKPTEMIHVIQKQQAQIENLQEKISEIELLKQEMAELKEAVAASTSKVVSAKKSTKKPKFRYKTTTAK